jgi:hypothetical protein
LIDYLKLGAETTYSDELDLEESDFETSLFPMQCYVNFKKSKKIVVKGRVVASIRFSWHRPLPSNHPVNDSHTSSHLQKASFVYLVFPWLSLPPQNQDYV